MSTIKKTKISDFNYTPEELQKRNRQSIETKKMLSEAVHNNSSGKLSRDTLTLPKQKSTTLFFVVLAIVILLLVTFAILAVFWVFL